VAIRAAIAALVVCAACHQAHEQPKLVVEVRAEWPGTDPDTMVASVTTPLEEVLASVPHIAALTSVTTGGETQLLVTLDGNDVLAAAGAVQAALAGTAARMPPDMMPPLVSIAGVPAGRYLVPREAAVRASDQLAETQGVARVARCGDSHVEHAIDVDMPRLAALGATVSDVVTAVRAADPTADLGRLQIATHDGAPVYVQDVAQIHDASEPAPCALVTPSQDLVELVVDVQPGANIDALRAAVAKLGAVAVPRKHEQHARLGPDMVPARAPVRIRDALSRLHGSYLVEVRTDDVRIIDGGAPVLAALSQASLVAGGGEPTAVVHVSGADPRAVTEAARSISDRLRKAGMLVATRGLETTATLQIDIDHDRAAQLGVRASDIADTLAATAGIVVMTSVTETDVVVRTPGVSAQNLDGLFVHGTGGALIPLTSVVTNHTVSGPVEILHRGRLRDVDLEVHGTPAIGAVPAGVRVDVDQYQR
jgi:multidrug efflux pump subunit AcrB